MSMTGEQQAKIIERTTREVVEQFYKPVIRGEVIMIVQGQLAEMVQRAVRQETNRPWRWHFKIGRTEVALRRVRD